MAYGTPADPVGGTVITVAYAVANLLDPIRWLRLLTGNADPPGSNYVVVSTSTSGTSWQKIPADALAAGAALANIADASISHTKLAPSAALANISAGSISSVYLAAGAALGNLAAASINQTLLAVDAALANITAGSITNVYLAAGTALANLGFTPINKAGDTGVGNITSTGTIGALALAVGTGGQTNTGVIGSSVATGTAPFTIASTTEVANLKSADSGKLGGVAAAGYPTLAGGGNFTTAPTVGGIGLGTANQVSYGASGTLTVTTSLQDIPSLSITVGRAGIYLLIGEANFTAAASEGVGSIQLDISGVASGQLRNCGIGIAAQVMSYSGTVMYVASLSAGVIVKLRAVKSSGAGSTQVVGGTLTATRITE